MASVEACPQWSPPFLSVMITVPIALSFSYHSMDQPYAVMAAISPPVFVTPWDLLIEVQRVAAEPPAVLGCAPLPGGVVYRRGAVHKRLLWDVEEGSLKGVRFVGLVYRVVVIATEWVGCGQEGVDTV